MKGLVIILAGAGLGALLRILDSSDRRRMAELESALGALDRRLSDQASSQANRIEQLEAELRRHENVLGDVPSNAQTMAMIEQLVETSLARIDNRFSSYNESIETLRSAVSRTEKLMETVLADLRLVTANGHHN